jgi:hypothetical protein
MMTGALCLLKDDATSFLLDPNVAFAEPYSMTFGSIAQSAAE